LQGSLSKICHFVSGPHACMKFSVSIRPFSLCFNTDWLQSIQRTTLQLSAVLWRTMPTFCLMGHKHTYILLVWQSSCKNHLPFDKFISSWYVTKNMTILFLAQRFQIITSSNFLTQPPNCLLRFCPEAKLYSLPLHQHPTTERFMIWVLCTVPQKFPCRLGLYLSSSCIECVGWNLHQLHWKNGIHSSLLPEEPSITKPITWIPLPLTLSLKLDSRVKESTACRPPRFPTNLKVWVLALPIGGSKFQSRSTQTNPQKDQTSLN
jgi:hypothetical protein